MNTGNRIAITYTETVDCIVISGFQAKLYPVKFSLNPIEK